MLQNKLLAFQLSICEKWYFEIIEKKNKHLKNKIKIILIMFNWK